MWVLGLFSNVGISFWSPCIFECSKQIPRLWRILKRVSQLCGHLNKISFWLWFFLFEGFVLPLLVFLYRNCGLSSAHAIQQIPYLSICRRDEDRLPSQWGCFGRWLLVCKLLHLECFQQFLKVLGILERGELVKALLNEQNF